MQNHSYENEFRLQVHCHAKQTHFHLNGFALRLVLKQRHKGPGNGLFESATVTGHLGFVFEENTFREIT